MRQSTIAVLLVSVVALAACQDDAAKLAEHMSRGEAYVEEGQLKEAIIEFKSALQLDPNNADGHYQLAHAFLRDQKPREGYWELRETVRLAPDNHDAAVEFGQLAVIAGESDEAMAQMNRVLEADPANAKAYLVRAQAHGSLEDQESAYADYLAAVAAEPDNETALRALGRFQARRQEFEESRATFQQLIAAHPKFDNYVLMSALVGRMGDEGRAEQEQLLLKALEIAEGAERGNAYSHLTSYYVGEKRSPEAYALLEKGVETETEAKIDVIYLLARLYKSEGDAEEAERLIVSATREAPDDARTYLVLAAYRARTQNDMASALEAIDKSLEIDPDNQLAKLQKAEILSEMGFRGDLEGGVEQAATLLAEVIAEEPTNSDALLVSAKIKLGSGDLDGAVAQLRQAIDSRPNWAQAHHLLGLALAAQKDYPAARVELARALEIDSSHADARLILAQVHFKLGEWEYTVERAREYMTIRPGSNKATLIMAQSLVRLGKIEEAERQLMAIPEDARDGEVLFALGRIQQAYGNTEESRQYLLASHEQYPTNWEVLQALLVMDRADGRLDESKQRIEAAIEQEPENPKLQQLRGLLAYNDGDLEGAEAYFRKSIELDPMDLTGYTQLARFFAKTGKLEQTTELYEEALTFQPEEAQIHHFLGVLYELSGNRERAIARYEEAVKYGPELAEAKNNLAYLYADSDRELDRALDLAQDAKAQLPDNPSVSDTLGWVLYKRGVPSAAISYLKEAERLTDPGDSSMGVVRWHLAQAYEANGEETEALATADKALESLAAQREALRTKGAEPKDEPGWAADARAMQQRLQPATASS
ncbi:MAG: tetratricopeptide repeat protein [Myxococcota bacterium]